MHIGRHSKKTREQIIVSRAKNGSVSIRFSGSPKAPAGQGSQCFVPIEGRYCLPAGAVR